MAVIQRKGVDGKVCSTCRDWKPLAEFPSDRTHRPSQGFKHCRCTACHRAAYHTRKAWLHSAIKDNFVPPVRPRTEERAHLPVSLCETDVLPCRHNQWRFYHLTAKTGSRSGGQSAAAHADYIEREGKYARGEDDDVVHRESGHMPEWAQDDPRT